MKKVIIVTGTPGTGKTTISKLLAKQIDAKYVPLTQHVTSNKLFNKVDRSRASKIMNLTKTRANLRNLLLKEHRTVVVDSHVPDIVAPKGVVKRVFVLRCHPKILKSRLRSKKWKKSKIRENLLAEILDACLVEAVAYYGRRAVFEIDTSHKSAGWCVTRAKVHLRQNSARKGRTVDWITRLNREHSLLRYIR